MSGNERSEIERLRDGAWNPADLGMGIHERSRAEALEALRVVERAAEDETRGLPREVRLRPAFVAYAKTYRDSFPGEAAEEATPDA